MATTIKLKSSATASAVPSLSNLSLRELAINTADGKLYIRKGTGAGTDTIVDIGGSAQGTQLSEEEVEDYVGGMVTGNTETGITVTYDDTDGTLDFVVDSQTDENFTTTLKEKLDNIDTSADNDALALAIALG